MLPTHHLELFKYRHHPEEALRQSALTLSLENPGLWAVPNYNLLQFLVS